MTILRVYDPAECDSEGKPLDWERCRACRFPGPGARVVTVGPNGCVHCDGHGSLKAAALALCHVEQNPRRPDEYPTRCEGCGHPMSDGTWERDGSDVVPYGDASLHTTSEEMWLRAARRGGDPNYQPVHYSPCDKGCDHGGPVFRRGPRGAASYNELPPGSRLGFEASWRQVDVRCLGWPHDLRPERLAVLCLRCWAKRWRREL